MNSTIRRAMVSERQEASCDWVLGLLMTKLWVSLSLKEHCVPEVPKEQPQQSTIYWAGAVAGTVLNALSMWIYRFSQTTTLHTCHTWTRAQGPQDKAFSSYDTFSPPIVQPRNRVKAHRPWATVRTCSLDYRNLLLKSVLGLEEHSFLALGDNQHRKTGLKKIVKDTLGSAGHHIVLATRPGRVMCKWIRNTHSK